MEEKAKSRAAPATSSSSRPKRSKDEILPEPPPVSQVDPQSFLGRLAGKPPSEILAKISAGDPLGLQGICSLRLRDQALLIDFDRLLERSLAAVAIAASRSSADEFIPEWLLGQVDLVIRGILAEDAEEERLAPGSPPRDPKYYRFVYLAYAVEVGLVRTATVNFNALPIDARQAFFLLLVDGRPVDDCVRELGTTRGKLREDTLDGLRALGHIKPGEVIGSSKRKRRPPGDKEARP